MKIVSLFSGAGGLDLGFKLAGHEIIWANDIDSDAVETYKHNVDDHIICKDIKDIDIASIPDCDLIVGGFPCQGFSQANMLRSAEDSRNTLYKFYLKALIAKQPKFFVAENVKGILSLDNGNAINKILSDFKSAGYIVKKWLINMADYGVPQTRQRVIIIGQRNDISKSFLLNFPSPTNSRTCKEGLPQWISIKEAIERFPNPDLPNDVLNHEYSHYKVEYRNFTAHRKTNPDKPSPTILARGNGKGGVCAIPHYNGNRRLTVRESAAIQTFPDSFKFFGSRTSCYRQIGNAVPVLFARKLGDSFLRVEEELKR